jgi:hypothetical protein
MIEEVLHIMTDVPHWIAHVSMDLVCGLVLYPFGRWALKRHDRKHNVKAETDYIYRRLTERLDQ